MTTTTINTISETIVWAAKERMKAHRYQNVASAIHAVQLDIAQELMAVMAEENRKESANA